MSLADHASHGDAVAAARVAVAEGRRIERLEQIVRDEDEPPTTRLLALGELAHRGHTDSFANIAITTACATVGLAALEYLTGWRKRAIEEPTFVAIVRGPMTQVPVRLAALEHVHALEELARIAISTKVPEVGVRAVLRLVEAGTRSQLLEARDRAENAHVRLFAHALLAQDDGK